MSQMRTADPIWSNTANGVFVFGKRSANTNNKTRLWEQINSSRLSSSSFCPWRSWSAYLSAEGTTDRQREGEHVRLRGCDRHWVSGCKHLPPAAGHGWNVGVLYDRGGKKKCFSLPLLCSIRAAAGWGHVSIVVSNYWLKSSNASRCLLCKSNCVQGWWCMCVCVYEEGEGDQWMKEGRDARWIQIEGF